MSELRNNNFIFTFKKIPGVQYSLQRINLPSVSVGAIPIPSPVLDYPIPGDKITYGQVTFDFIVDEDLTNYIELWNWMHSFANPRRSEQNPVIVNDRDKMSDGTLTILSNNKNPLKSVDYIDCFPQTIGDLQFDTTSESDIMICSVVLEYSYLKFVE